MTSRGISQQNNCFVLISKNSSKHNKDYENSRENFAKSINFKLSQLMPNQVTFIWEPLSTDMFYEITIEKLFNFSNSILRFSILYILKNLLNV